MGDKEQYEAIKWFGIFLILPAYLFSIGQILFGSLLVLLHYFTWMRSFEKRYQHRLPFDKNPIETIIATFIGVIIWRASLIYDSAFLFSLLGVLPFYIYGVLVNYKVRMGKPLI